MWKDMWDVALGVAYIPIDKLDPQTDLVRLLHLSKIIVLFFFLFQKKSLIFSPENH